MAAIERGTPLVLGQPGQPGQTDDGQEDDLAAVEQEIADLEARLQAARQRRASLKDDSFLPSAQHFFLLLADSALPLGSFAFSSGLESFLAHGHGGNTNRATAMRGADAFAAFLPLSLASFAAASLPFVLAAHDAAAKETPEALAGTLALLDDTYDATILCTVGRRASVAQGRALLSLWERSFVSAIITGNVDPLRPYAQQVKRSSAGTTGTTPLALAPSAHLPPLFGAVAGLARLSRRQTADVFMLAHAKALVSAAVRSNLVGPYQAQRMLASERVQRLVAEAVDRSWEVPVEEAGQTVPVVDLWMGRHEMLYSRIFNS